MAKATEFEQKRQDRKRPRGGRTRGARDTLNATFLMHLQSYWYDNGPDIFDEARQADPVNFVKITADLIPKVAHVTGRVEGAASDVDRGLSATSAFLAALGETQPETGEAGTADAGPNQSLLPLTLPDGESRH